MLVGGLASVSDSDAPTDGKPALRRRRNAFKDRETFRIDMRHIVGQVREFASLARRLGADGNLSSFKQETDQTTGRELSLSRALSDKIPAG